MLGDRIYKLRTDRGITQKEFAKILNISNSTLSQYESNLRVPSDDIKIKIATYFDVSLDYLLGITNIKNTETTSVDEEFSELLNDPELLVAFKDLMNLSDDDKKEIIKYIKYKKDTK